MVLAFYSTVDRSLQKLINHNLTLSSWSFEVCVTQKCLFLRFFGSIMTIISQKIQLQGQENLYDFSRETCQA